MSTRKIALVAMSFTVFGALAWSQIAPKDATKERKGSREETAIEDAPPRAREIVVRHEVAHVGNVSAAASSPDNDRPAVEPAGAPTPEEVDATVEFEFQSESRTHAGRELERSLRAAFSAPDVTGARIEHLECRTARCKLQVAFVNASADHKVLFQVVENPDLNLAFVVPHREVDDDGTVHASIYMFPDEMAPWRGRMPPNAR